jgi:hypothetical protein
MYEITVICPECGRQLPIAATDMHDQAALDARGLDDPVRESLCGTDIGRRLLLCSRRSGAEADKTES